MNGATGSTMNGVTGRAGVRERRNWNSDDLTIRGAALKYRVPKSTLHDHASHKVEPLSRLGPPPVLSREEENDLEPSENNRD